MHSKATIAYVSHGISPPNSLPRIPSLTLMIITVIQCFTNLMFNNKNLVTLNGQPLKLQFYEIQYS